MSRTGRHAVSAAAAAVLVLLPSSAVADGGHGHGPGHGDGHCHDFDARGYGHGHGPGHGHGDDCDDDDGDGGYADPGQVSLSEFHPRAGETFQVYVETSVADEVTIEIASHNPTIPDESIEIAGAASATAPVEDGVATFDVTIDEPSRYSVEATSSEDGSFIGAASFTVIGDGHGGDDGDHHGPPDHGDGGPGWWHKWWSLASFWFSGWGGHWFSGWF
ncbi:hypothetical protein [Georgenia alba]|uniref:Uncharacterized protein n=1 Tax=Georgenia alba TaxID=2233858 RepID=A0ABW2Q847_9MICO